MSEISVVETVDRNGGIERRFAVQDKPQGPCRRTIWIHGRDAGRPGYPCYKVSAPHRDRGVLVGMSGLDFLSVVANRSGGVEIEMGGRDILALMIAAQRVFGAPGPGERVVGIKSDMTEEPDRRQFAVPGTTMKGFVIEIQIAPTAPGEEAGA